MLTRLEEIHRKSVEKTRAQPEETEMEWRSFQSLPRGDMSGGLKPAEK